MEEKIKKIIEEMRDDDKLSLWNKYCGLNNLYNDYIYYMEEFDTIMDGEEPWKIVRWCYFGEFNPTHQYFWFNDYGNLESTDYIDDKIDIDEIVDYIIDNEEDFVYTEIMEALEEMEEEE